MAKRQKTHPSTASAREKPKTTRRKSLRNIKVMPLDILFEIFGYLEPFDLLRLSRTNKDLRQILMSKSSILVWKSARMNVDLRDPIPSLSEPAFAHLLFDHHCHFCLTAVVQNILWDAITRCCRRCLEREFKDIGEITEIFGDQIKKCSLELWKIFPHTWVRGGILYMKSAVEKCIEKYERLSSNQRKPWLAKELETIEARYESVERCQWWEIVQMRVRGAELHHTREARFEAIIARLRQSGWGEELDWVDDRGNTEPIREKLRRHKLVNQPKLLTDRSMFFPDWHLFLVLTTTAPTVVWKNIAPALNEFLSSERVDFLQARLRYTNNTRLEVLVNILEQREQELPRDLVMPALFHLLLLEPFRTVIEDLPVEAGSEPSLFDDALLKLPSIIQEWNDSRIQIVLTALQQEFPEATKDGLFLATSLFCCANPECDSCEVYSYPAILLHSCSSPYVPDPYWLDDMSVIRLVFGCDFGWQWTCTDSDSFMVELHPTAVVASRVICKITNRDVRSTTIDAMFKSNVLVECRACTTVLGSRLFMRWTSAINHLHSDRFCCVSEEEKNMLLEREDQNEERDEEHRCTHCTFKSDITRPMEEHLVSAHGITDVQEDDFEFYPRTVSLTGNIGPVPLWRFPLAFSQSELREDLTECARLLRTTFIF
ncbi:hypothetical protein L218DRAFT_963925 [Marasmius fiardii PR-910]|nr:hypothetical protein L218DRAFT_963925 [Marasmius fiardii PR-910]